ncbi:MAG: hypothetical protein EP310_08765 [Bacteroidetes bacterium]|nr:MAG: hypothetical protein EP310_08765 [Bacteroidota bacterium]
MKKILSGYLVVFILLIFSTLLLNAQPLPGPGENGDPIRPAPVGPGLVILAGMTAAYAAGKVFVMKKRNKP